MTDSTTERTTNDEPVAVEQSSETAVDTDHRPSKSARRRGKRYQRARLLCSAAELIVEVLVLGVLLVTGASAVLRDWAGGSSGNPWIVVFVYFIPIGGIFAVISAVFGAVGTFGIDRRYGLSTQSAAGWTADNVKGFLVGGVLAIGCLEVLYALLRNFPETWWVGSAVVFSIFLIVFAHLGPVLIFPIFFKFKRLTNAEITGRLERLAREANTRVNGVYEMDLSRKTRTANAALLGFGRTRRIALADNLLDNFTLDEIEAVLAHEFGHHKLNHLGKAMAIQSATFFVLFFGIHLGLMLTGNRWGIQGIGDVANFPLVALLGTAMGFLVLPITNSLLRRFERHADDYALRFAQQPWAFCSALERLGQMNLADRNPHPVIEWMFYSHPSLGTRIDEAAKKLNERGISVEKEN